MGQAMSDGLCWLHSGRSHVMSPEGAARKSQKAREHMNRMWAERWGPNGRKLSDEAGRRSLPRKSVAGPTMRPRTRAEKTHEYP
jgi:hypothetical protein